MVQKIIPEEHNSTIKVECKQDEDYMFITALPEKLIV